MWAMPIGALISLNGRNKPVTLPASVANRLVKPTSKTKFHIDFEWWERESSAFQVYLISHLCPEHQTQFAEHPDGELIDNIDPETHKAMPRMYKLEENGYDGVVHDPSEINAKMAQVIEKSNEWGDKIPLGIFYQNEHVPTYQERIAARIPDYLENSPAAQQIADKNNKPITNIDRLLSDLLVSK